MIQLESAGQRLRLDNSEEIVENGLHVLFNENRITGMLEASDYALMHKVYFYLRAIVSIYSEPVSLC